jgi:DeoR family transcriptional regulator, aga operon transcriptional repressor
LSATYPSLTASVRIEAAHHRLSPSKLRESRAFAAGTDLLFLAVDGFDIHYGLTPPNQLEARVNRAMAESARRTIVVCDSSKFGRRSLSLILDVSAVHETITDRGISKLQLKALREAEVDVTVV